MSNPRRLKVYKDTLAMLPENPRFKAEYERLFGIFAKLPPDMLEVARKVISRAAFMVVTLEDLEQTIAKDGVVSEYKNGDNQWGTKKSPEVEVYNTIVKNYTMITKQLVDLLPEENRGEAQDDFASFCASR